MKQRKSCINLQPAKPGCFYHISREVIPDYLIDTPAKNAYDRNAKEAGKYFKKLLKQATHNYMARTKQRLQVKEDKFLWEAVLVLNEHHTIKDVKRLAEYMKKKYGWQPVQIGVHRDEGYVDEITCKPIYNYHAHIVFFMLDKSGIYRFKRRDFSKKTMANIQTEVAYLLGMERGKDKRSTGRERFSAKQYRQAEKKNYDLQCDLNRIQAEANSMVELALREYELRINAERELEKLKASIKSENNPTIDSVVDEDYNEDINTFTFDSNYL